MIGYSGAGKGEVIGALKADLEDKGGTVIHVSTGDLFREAQKRDEELAAMMARGVFIPDLNGVTPELTMRMIEFLGRLKRGEQVALILDGAWRRGEYQYQDRTIIAQSMQLAIAMGRALKVELGRIPGSLITPGVLGAISGEQFEVGVETTGTRYLRNKLLLKANHVSVDVEAGDAEALMRLRGAKDVTKILKGIQESEGEEVEEARGVLIDMVRIMKGQVIRNEVDKIVICDALPDLTLRQISQHQGQLMDEAMQGIVEKLGLLVKTDSDEKTPGFGVSMKRLINKLGLSNVTLPRSDDLTYESRTRRIKEFQDNTVIGVMQEELGFAPNELGIMVPDNSRSEIGPRHVIVNGPARGVDYAGLVKAATETATRIARGVST
jgi:hypothetical protein